jgi:hypothetical protein
VLPVNADYALGCRWEPMGPATDFNGDGDTSDSIAQIVDLATGAVTSTDLAIDLSDPMRLGQRTAFVIVDEASHGSGSLNGDGDTNDDILHLVDLGNGNVHNTGMDVHTRAFFTAPYTLWAQNSGNLIFAVSEAAHGSRDLNGDGDANDLVVHIQDF